MKIDIKLDNITEITNALHKAFENISIEKYTAGELLAGIACETSNYLDYIAGCVETPKQRVMDIYLVMLHEAKDINSEDETEDETKQSNN